MTGPMDMTVLTTVVVNVWMIFPVTNRQVIAIWDVSPDMVTFTVAKVNLQIIACKNYNQLISIFKV